MPSSYYSILFRSFSYNTFVQTLLLQKIFTDPPLTILIIQTLLLLRLSYRPSSSYTYYSPPPAKLILRPDPSYKFHTGLSLPLLYRPSCSYYTYQTGHPNFILIVQAFRLICLLYYTGPPFYCYPCPPPPMLVIHTLLLLQYTYYTGLRPPVLIL